jgi:phosphatidylinositol alpha 1,6-mannosyltransferase
MRIAYFNATLKPGQDGVTRVVHKMIEGALAREHGVMGFSALVPEPDNQIVPFVKVRSLVLPLQKAYRIPLPNYHALSRSLNNFQPDILHINSPCLLACAAVKYGQDFNVPVVATYHTHFPTYPRYYKLNGAENLTWKILKSLYNRIAETFVPTMPILEELHDHGIERLEYLPNGVDLQLFTPEYRSAAWRRRITPTEKPIILFVSRLVWEKDLRDLADMYRILRSRRNDFEMVLVGDGHARREVERLMPGAHFLGFQTGRTLSESYASADIFVFPSTTETFGLVTLEAMASGLVPVAAKVGGAVEIIEEGTSGLFAVPHGPFDLAAKVERLLDRPEERREMARKVIARAQHFGWGKILDKLFKSYEEVIESHKNSSVSILQKRETKRTEVYS